MSGLFGWPSIQFDKLLEKATSHLLMETDWDTILQICDCIRQNDVQPKYVVSCLKKKLYAQNPHVVLYTLQVLESIVKNCGAPIHAEIASRPFMEELRDVVKNSTNENVKNRILELIQAWAYAFRNEPKFRAVQDVFNLLRMEGYKLQVLKESDAMFVADTAPDWADSDCCHRCRVQFGVMQRKHHCRNCGQIFCKTCSSRTMPIPRYGFEKEVRVCEACWETLSKPVAGAKSPPNVDTSPKQVAKFTGSPSSNSTATSGAVPTGGKSEQELKEEEELQLALALSQSEAESKEKSQVLTKSPPHLTYSSSLPETESVGLPKKSSLTSSDSELDRYLNRSYWEQRQQQQKDDSSPAPVSDTRTSPIPSAPVPSPAIQTVNYNSTKTNETYQNGDIEEMAGFLANLKSSLEIFVNRMKSNSSRGRPIANDTYVQSQFMNITNMHSQLLKYIQEQEDTRAHYETLQDKLNQIRDARAALDALREEHQEKLRREAEEAERQRQIQMAYKLDIMRKKKQEYLQYQRQLAIQRMQEQEREMQLRHEQQKQQYVQVIHPGNNHQGVPPGVYPPQQQYMPSATPPQSYPGMPNAGNRPEQQQPYTPQFRPPQPDPQQMHAPEYRQPFNMQAMGGALPTVPPGAQFPQQQPRIPASSAAPVVTSAQNPQMIVMHPGMMGPMPGPMGPMMPPNMGQVPLPQNAAGPNHHPHQIVPGNMPHMMPPPEHRMPPPEHRMPPPEHRMPPPEHHPPPPPEKESEPLIVFD